MRVDFYKVEMPDGVEFKDVLAKAKALKKTGDARVGSVDGVPYRLLDLTTSGKSWQGDVCRIRMRDVPFIASVKVATTKNVALTEDQGIGEATAFYYDETTNVLAIQANRMGIAASRLAILVGDFAKLEEPIIPTTVLRLDAATQLLRMKDYRKVQVRFAGIENPMLITADRPSAKRAVKLLEGAKAPHIDITISAGHFPCPLDFKAVTETLRTYLGWVRGSTGSAEAGEHVESLKVVGTLDSETSKELDLLQYRMSEDVTVEVDKKTKRLLYADRKKALQSAFDSRSKELRKMFVDGGEHGTNR